MIKQLKIRASTSAQLTMCVPPPLSSKIQAVVPIIGDSVKPSVIIEGSWEDWIMTADIKCKNVNKQWICLLATWSRMLRRQNMYLLGGSGVCSSGESTTSDESEDAERELEIYGLTNTCGNPKDHIAVSVCLEGGIHKNRRLREKVKVARAYRVARRLMTGERQEEQAQLSDSDFTDVCNGECEKYRFHVYSHWEAYCSRIKLSAVTERARATIQRTAR